MKAIVLPRSFLSLVGNFLCPLLLAVLPAGIQAQLVADGATLGLSGRANQLRVLAGGTVDMGDTYRSNLNFNGDHKNEPFNRK